jgi:hypothetical protein
MNHSNRVFFRSQHGWGRAGGLRFFITRLTSANYIAVEVEAAVGLKCGGRFPATLIRAQVFLAAGG